MVESLDPISDEMLSQLEQGVMLHGEKHATLPAKAERLATYSLRLSICEGKYHQVKRMLAAVGNKVVELHRENIGGIELDNTLAAGEYRLLNEHEIALIN